MKGGAKHIFYGFILFFIICLLGGDKMLKNELKRFAVVSAMVGIIFMGGIAFFGGLSAIAEETEAPSATEETNAVILKISGMTCGACSTKVKTALEHCDGVIQAEVSHKTGKAVVKVEEGKTDAEGLIEAIKKAGFKAES